MNILMFLFIVGLLVFSVFTRRRELSLSAGWVETAASLVSSRKIVNGEDVTTFIDVAYFFYGKEYFAEELTVDGVDLTSLDKGTPVVVFVDPAFPQRCMIKRSYGMDGAIRAILKA